MSGDFAETSPRQPAHITLAGQFFRIHKQVYAGFSGALVATLLLAAVTDVQSTVDQAAATQLNDAIHKSMLQLAHNGTLPNSAVHSTTDGTIMSPLVLAVPIVSGLAMQLCVRDVSVLGTLGSLVLAILAAMAGTVDGSVSLMLQYWAYSTFIIVVFLSLPSAVASGLLPQSAVCTAALTTWQRPDAAVIKRNIELGESREATGTMFGNSDSASTSVGPGVASRMPLNVHTDGAAVAITGTAPLNDSDSEEEPDNEQAASAARYGSTWHIPRDDGGSIVVFHSGETCVSSQARAPVTASSAAPHTGRSLHPRWRVFVPPPRRLDGASAPQLPREHASSAPVSWSFSRWWPFGHTTPSTATHGSPVEAAPLLSSGNVEEAVARAGAGNDSAAQGTPGQQGVSGLGIDSTDVDLFDMAGDDSDGSTRGHFLGGGEEQGSRGGTGTTPHSRPAQRPKEYNK